MRKLQNRELNDNIFFGLNGFEESMSALDKKQSGGRFPQVSIVTYGYLAHLI